MTQEAKQFLERLETFGAPTQTARAEMLGVLKQSLSPVERGDREPSRSMWIALELLETRRELEKCKAQQV